MFFVCVIMKTLNSAFFDELKNISDLSEKVNGKDKNKIFQMIKEHSDEIKDLYCSDDSHWAVETADLIVLCFELLISENKDIDEVFDVCLPRFNVKLKGLLEKRC